MVAVAEGKLHIVVFPWLAFGHMLPLLELSKRLARRGHLVSFITTPKNLQRLPKVPPELSHLLRLITFPLPRVDGMAEGVEATSDLPPADLTYLMKALDVGLEQPFRRFVDEASPKPDWIIHDYAQHWASNAGVPCVFFSPVPSAALAYFGNIAELGSTYGDLDPTAPRPWVPFPTRVALRRHEVLPPDRPNHSAASEGQRLVASIARSKAVALRSCWELEPEWLPLLQQVYRKPVLPVGLVPSLATERDDDRGAEVLEWLNQRNIRSVVYVALGSEVTISRELLHELALGLEIAELPFLWGLRRPFGSSDDGADILPAGFEERTKGYGKVVIGWVPQLKVLAHASVGGFLTHCGWGSICEGLQFGHPLVMLPVFGEQGLSARMLEEKGFGVEVERKEEDGSFTREEVRKALRLIMADEEKGDACRKKAEEMKEAIADKQSQEKHLDDFLHYLLSNRTA